LQPYKQFGFRGLLSRVHSDRNEYWTELKSESE